MPIRHAIASLYWRCSRWTIVDDGSSSAPGVIVGAPHTSNWDGFFMLAIAWKRRSPVRWLGKAALFRGPLGPIMRSWGGIAVDRKNPAGVVSEVLTLLDDGEAFHVIVAPDGTRHGDGTWKSGFYRIAHAAELPVTMGFVDRPTMTVGLGPTVTLTGDVAADMDKFRAFYANKHGFRPNPNRGLPRLKNEG
jgi:1-acyl-sn-glycerol-3-phosphate acyltransferase